MKKLYVFSFVSVMIALLIFSGNVSAIVFGGDDGTELFVPSNQLFNVEVLDLGAATSFGFYFDGTDVTNPANLITIFGPEDETTSGDIQTAGVDFNAEIVYDIDDSQIQSSFTDLGLPIGFYADFDLGTIFTDPSLNPGGEDLAETRPCLSDCPLSDIYRIDFKRMDTTLTTDIVSGVKPVPEPSMLLLIGTGLSGLVIWRKKWSAIKKC